MKDIYAYSIKTGKSRNLSETCYNTMDDDEADQLCEDLNRIVHDTHYWVVRNMEIGE